MSAHDSTCAVPGLWLWLMTAAVIIRVTFTFSHLRVDPAHGQCSVRIFLD